MLDIKFIRENPDLVKENIRKKFQNAKLPLVDEVIALDSERREAINEGEALKAERNKLSKANGPLFGRLKKCADEAEKAALQAEIDANNAAVKANAERMTRLEEKNANAIIGHFGLGFYSSFMVASKVEIITKSYKEGSKIGRASCRERV